MYVWGGGVSAKKANCRKNWNPKICSKNEKERLQMNLLGEREKGKGHPKISYPWWQNNSGAPLLIEETSQWVLLRTCPHFLSRESLSEVFWVGWLKWVTCIKISPKKTIFFGTLSWSRESLSEVCWGQGVLMVSAAAAPPDWSPASSPLKLKIENWSTNCAHKCLLAAKIKNWYTNCTNKCLLAVEIENWQTNCTQKCLLTA